MSVRNRLIVAVLWLATLTTVAVVARAQAPQPAPRPGLEVPAQTFLSGDDIAFRIDAWQGKTPVGTLVVRVNGQWVEPGMAKKMMPITK